ncbi:hypothetical protein AORI_4826 [Amycolatopsis keratiniphila]|uniref:Uncharacterized protein n=1 Tax=Amycolatopsis keratiniphila TaxID=129921 RepID=R4SY32_9PSEU|nr:hypothetical protein AORI_4826 [Amycolatopsis keratiniphila]
MTKVPQRGAMERQRGPEDDGHGQREAQQFPAGNRSRGTRASVIERFPSGIASSAATTSRRRRSRTRAKPVSGSSSPRISAG